MKNYLVLLLLPLCFFAKGQITITATDMPVSGDTLRYSIAQDSTTINLTLTGPNTSWDFSNLHHLRQEIDTYKTAGQVNSAYVGTISDTAYGTKLLDSIPGSSNLPIVIQNIYTFFNKKNSPSRFIAEGLGAEIGGFPTPIAYSDEDEWYFFPLDYNDFDSSTYRISFGIASTASFSNEGYRLTTVDGWGTIKTPFYTSPDSCLRVRSELVELDSVTIGTQTTVVIRNMVEYRWHIKGEHYPALWVVANIVAGQEIPTLITYRDHWREPSLGIVNTHRKPISLHVYPNPVADGKIKIDIPPSWNHYFVEVFDMQGKSLIVSENQSVLDVSTLAKGNYIVRIMSGGEFGYTSFIK